MTCFLAGAVFGVLLVFAATLFGAAASKALRN